MLTLAAVLLSVGVVLYALMVRETEVPPGETESPLDHLEQRKAAIYDSLRDLVFEYRVGKLSDQDYEATKRELQNELAGISAEIARLAGELAEAGRTETTAAAPAAPAPAVQCPHCGARFPQPMKFCGECGKPMSTGAV